MIQNYLRSRFRAIGIVFMTFGLECSAGTAIVIDGPFTFYSYLSETLLGLASFSSVFFLISVGVSFAKRNHELISLYALPFAISATIAILTRAYLHTLYFNRNYYEAITLFIVLIPFFLVESPFLVLDFLYLCPFTLYDLAFVLMGIIGILSLVIGAVLFFKTSSSDYTAFSIS